MPVCIVGSIRRPGGGIGGETDQSMDVVWHHDRRIQPGVRAFLRRSLPFLRRNAPGGRQADDAVPNRSEKRYAVRGAEGDEVPCRPSVIPAVEADGVRMIMPVPVQGTGPGEANLWQRGISTDTRSPAILTCRVPTPQSGRVEIEKAPPAMVPTGPCTE